MHGKQWLGIWSVVVFCLTCHAQPVISVHAGLILFAEGSVLVDGKPYAPVSGRWSQVPENATLETRDGKADVLLAPGVFVRLGPQTGMRLVSDKLFDIQIEFIGGSAIVEATNLQPDNSVLFVYHQQQIRVAEKGAYRLDSDPAQVVVHSGQIELRHNDSVLALAANQLFSFESGSVKDAPPGSPLDVFDRWAQERNRLDSGAAPPKPPDNWKRRLAKLWAVR